MTSRISSRVQPLVSAPLTWVLNSFGRFRAESMPRLTRLRSLRGSCGRAHNHPQQDCVTSSCIGMPKSSTVLSCFSTYSAPSTSLRTASPLSHSSFDMLDPFGLICARRSGERVVQLADCLDPQLDGVAGFEEAASSHAH